MVLPVNVTWAGFVGWADWLQEQEHFQSSHDPHHTGFTMYLKVKISQQQSKVSWRGKWTLCWGFWLPRFAGSWGCPTGESEGLSSGSAVGGRSRSSQVLQTFYPHHLWDQRRNRWGRWWRHFQGFVGVTVTLTSDCFSFLISCARGGYGAESPSPESPGGSQLHASV